MLWQEITDDGTRMVRLLDADGLPMRSPAVNYAIESTDPALWPIELLPRCKRRRLAELAAAYELAVVRDYPSAALGAIHTYPADPTAKLHMNARVSQALVVLTAPTWRAITPIELRQCGRPTMWNGWIYLCVTAGSTGSTEPAWPTTRDAEVQDGTARWRAWQAWTGLFVCKDGSEYVRRNHSMAQIIQVGMEGAAFVQAQLDRHDALATAITGAADVVSLDAIGLDFP